MNFATKRLDELCAVMTGAPMSRAKTLPPGEVGATVKVLIPRAMQDSRILDAELVEESVFKVKPELFTREGDIVVKASTPYDCAYVDVAHAGILVTSFGMILRARADAAIDMRYLAAYLSQPATRERLQGLSTGMTIQLIKNAALAAFEVPLIPPDQQARIAALFANTQACKEQCMRIIATTNQLLESEFCRAVFG